MDHPLPWLRYVEAGDLDDSSVKLDGMRVQSAQAEKLGTVDGLIIDVTSGRPYYIVVDAGGWFKSRFFLIAIGHVGLARTDNSLVADISKSHIDKFPGFDRDEFEKLSDAELERMDEQIAAACCPSELVERHRPASRFESWKHYREPGWWSSDFYRPNQGDQPARPTGGAPRHQR